MGMEQAFSLVSPSYEPASSAATSFIGLPKHELGTTSRPIGLFAQTEDLLQKSFIG